MNKFLGYTLVGLVKAVNKSNSEISHAYEVRVQNVIGRQETKIAQIQEVDRDYGRLRMKESQFAKISNGYCQFITEEEFHQLWLNSDQKVS
jgi:hypothetical protein